MCFLINVYPPDIGGSIKHNRIASDHVSFRCSPFLEFSTSLNEKAIALIAFYNRLKRSKQSHKACTAQNIHQAPEDTDRFKYRWAKHQSINFNIRKSHIQQYGNTCKMNFSTANKERKP
jgi:hypothetical protein